MKLNWLFRNRKLCRDFQSGWFCNRESNHPGKHRFWNAGTARGDDKLVEWEPKP